ncbi:MULTISPECIES: lysozyme inhibitor LprI family protein [Brucella/Ochrobactrum group]|jgi:uncharacterized protein YecT (DUF1311 family)|uniref:lysozyme inhibitor LprI family protein n=1 Tax=Brucella/Ochrobactrum group TaxID=2826938 RepID=UPI001C05081B|nr:lysozyme inhibitor LprI family protein [Brucella sp. NBRC 12950]QWK80218.1 DUF1311 domain-containing protein [Ochrobactrum sp. BTU1]
MKRALLAAIITVSATPVLADKIYDKCISKSDGSNSAWSQCGGDWLKRADDKLNATWKKAYSKADGQSKTDLLAEQRLWNSYKESSCNLYANGDWGREGQILNYPNCRASVIETRTKQLQEYNAFMAGQ